MCEFLTAQTALKCDGLNVNAKCACQQGHMTAFLVLSMAENIRDQVIAVFCLEPVLQFYFLLSNGFQSKNVFVLLRFCSYVQDYCGG